MTKMKFPLTFFLFGQNVPVTTSHDSKESYHCIQRVLLFEKFSCFYKKLKAQHMSEESPCMLINIGASSVR